MNLYMHGWVHGRVGVGICTYVWVGRWMNMSVNIQMCGIGGWMYVRMGRVAGRWVDRWVVRVMDGQMNDSSYG